MKQLRILIVDDDVASADSLLRLLTREGYANLHVCDDRRKLGKLCRSTLPDLILLDLHKPEPSAVDTLRSLDAFRTTAGFLPVLMVTADTEPAVRRRALHEGATDFVNRPFDAIELHARIRNLLHTRALYVQLRAEKAELARRVHYRTRALNEARFEVLGRLAQIAEFRDDTTGMHTRRVGMISASIANALGCSPTEVEIVRHAAPLHDLGKIGIPDAVLLKPGALDATEMSVMREHARLGARMLAGGKSPFLRVARDIALTHHERWDGRGYPAQLKGEQIPFEGRVVAAADFFDALRHDRPYREAQPLDVVLAMVRDGVGSHFDPEIARALLQVGPELSAQLH